MGKRTILCVSKIDQRADTSFDNFVTIAKNNNINKIFFVRNRNQTEVDA